MTDLNRRSFLRGLFTVAAVSIAPALPMHADLPRIVGDGIHDDTAGLQAALDGRPFVCEGDIVSSATEVTITGGEYKLSKTLRTPVDRYFRITNARFDGGAIPEGDCVLYCPSPQEPFFGSLDHVFIQTQIASGSLT